MPMQAATDTATKAEALRLARDVGPAEAARQLGLKAATIRSWRSRAGESGPPTGVDPVDWAAAKRKDAETASAAARHALTKVKHLLDENQTRRAQEASVTAGILVDKAGTLEAQARSVEEHNIKVAEEQARILADVIKGLFAAVDVPYGRPISQLIGELLRSAADNKSRERVDLSKLSDAELDDLEGGGAVGRAAAAYLRLKIREEIEPEIRHDLVATIEEEFRVREQERRDQILKLPAASVAGGDEDPSDWAGPKRRVVGVAPDEPETREPGPEVVDAEIVDEPLRFTRRRTRPHHRIA